MKKNSTRKNQSPKRVQGRAHYTIFIGVDLGDKTSRYCILNEGGEIVVEDSVETTRKALEKRFKSRQHYTIAIEVGAHSRWVSQLLEALGHRVYVANSRQVRLISDSSRKNDRLDASLLARLVRVDPQLLRPIRHRGERAQQHLMKIRVRAELVETRTALINSARGLAKSAGYRLAACATDYVKVELLATLPAELAQTLRPLLEAVEAVTRQILAIEAELEQIAREQYPETQRLRQVPGVGPLIALTFVLTIDDPGRFGKSRDIGCYVGLRPRQSESGERSPELSISKEGDRYLRKLLVQGAQQILRRSGPETDLKRWGWKLAGRGGKNAKKRAVVAVARKLGILLHRLWVSGERYQRIGYGQAGAAEAAA